jgi:hypothetical protein
LKRKLDPVSQANALADRVAQHASSIAADLRSGMMLANTVDPGHFLAGCIYFEPVKQAEAFVLRVGFGAAAFRFDLRAEADE